MPYCQHCGGEVAALADAVEAAEREPVEVTLARIQADRDVEVAKIEARAHRAELDTAETIAETQAEAEVEAAEAVAEIVTAAAEPEPEGDPIVVEVPEPEPEPEPEPDNAPPVITTPEPSRSKSPGYWDAYR